MLSVFAVVYALNLSLPLFTVNAMPYYGLNPKPIVVRAEFSTGFASSSAERKFNIKLAAKRLNNSLVDVGAEFSFNDKVGERTEKNGYKNAKIIVGGNFTDGVGGGVCQVSTTLYNALLLADLKITEYHPHSLAVSYVEHSFDAMVSYGYADLKFINNTKNPVIIKAFASDSAVTVKIMGQKCDYTVVRKSVLYEEVPFSEKEVFADKNEYPNLLKDQKVIKTYGKNGLKSSAYIIKKRNGKVFYSALLRKDFYRPITQIVVVGT